MVSRHVVTLANSIVGVSVLAMPFCFKQCGIVLATLSLMMGAVITRMVCYFLVKAALMNRRRTYEMLAWSTFGQTGKFMVEISIIGFLIGTLIAFMVVIGDIGPEIISEIFSVENNNSLRTIIMTALSLFVALPLGLLRNIDSLSSVSTASVLFYLFLVLKIFSEGIGPLWSGEYLERIHFWRSSGVLQCIPIFSMALSCQTQIFGIYDALPEPSLQKMNEVVKQAVYICTFFYFCVGFFGYIAFSNQNFGGNILLGFTPTWSTQLIKSMFLMSIVFSVPLVIFPCRASLHSLIFKSASAYHHVHDMTTNYIPESRLKFLTVTIVGFTLIVGILIPNIELVLGLVGSTTGSVICIIFPSVMFVRVTSKYTTERLVAQLLFFIGLTLMLLTTYATLYAAEQSQVQVKQEAVPESIRVTQSPLKPIPQKDYQLNSPVSTLDEGKAQNIPPVEFQPKISEKVVPKDNRKDSKSGINQSEVGKINVKKEKEKANNKINEISQKPLVNKHENQRLTSKAHNQSGEKMDIPEEKMKSKKDAVEISPNKDGKPVQHNDHMIENHNVIENKINEGQQNVGVNTDAKKELVDKNVAEEFLKRLEEHQENQKKLLEEQKEILEELKQHHAQDVKEKLEQEKEKQNDNEHQDSNVEDINVRPNIIEHTNEANSLVADKTVRVSVPSDNSDKIIKEQEKIIERISENLEKENKNAQLLEQLEEGLNKEVKKMDSNKKDGIMEAANVGASVVKSNQDEEFFKTAVVVNKSNHSIAKESVLMFDKDKGVLVGSLGAALLDTGEKKSITSSKEEIRHDSDKHSGELVKTDSQVIQPELDTRKSDAINSNGKIKEPKQHRVEFSESPPKKKVVSETPPKKKVVSETPPKKKVVSETAPKKKVVSETPPKEKIDREI